MTVTRRLLALVAAFLLAAAPAAAQDTSAVAVNEKDGSNVFELAFAVHQITGSDPVTQQNVAVAYASCEACTTVAISIQILLVMGDPDVIAPLNMAVAINESCTNCQTLAAAYQFVIALGTPVRLTGKGRRELRRIYRELRALQRGELPIEEVRARLDELMDELKAVLTTELVARKDRDERDEDDGEREADDQDSAAEEDEEEPVASPEPSATPTATPTPEPPAAPEATATPTETPTPEPTATPDATATP